MESTMLAAVLLTAMALSGNALGAPVQWPTAVGGNGHYYEVEESVSSWFDARSAAEAATHNGVSGHLATITSAAENDFLVDALPLDSTRPDSSYWLGGYQSPDAAEPGGGWQWVTGETWGYTNWNTAQGEPNDRFGQGGEDHLMIYAWTWPGKWNDLEGPLLLPHIVEYVPEPASLALLALGGLGIIRRNRGRQGQ